MEITEILGYFGALIIGVVLGSLAGRFYPYCSRVGLFAGHQSGYGNRLFTFVVGSSAFGWGS